MEKIINGIASRLSLKLDRNLPQYQAGFHQTFDLSDKYIVKIEDEKAGTLDHQKFFLDLLYAKGAKVPKVVEFGHSVGQTYLVTKKVAGDNLSIGWLSRPVEQREEIIKDLAEQLRIFHSVKFGQYLIPVLSNNLQGSLKESVLESTKFKLIKKDKLAPKYRACFELLQDFFQKKIYLLDEENTAVLVHNDIHLENLIGENKGLNGIIDFDWVCQAPKDYELWKIVEVAREPRHTVNGELLPLAPGYQMVEEFGWLKKYYPELFEASNLANRIRLYYIQELINNRFLDFQKGTLSEDLFSKVQSEIEDIFVSDWLDKLLNL